MLPYFKEQFGNPSSIHKYGRLAFMAVQNARKRIASLINAEPAEILLTSGGTESNNTALYGIANNEVGTIQPIKEICKIAHEKSIPMHTDAVQAVGKIPIDVKDLDVDLLSISSH